MTQRILMLVLALVTLHTAANAQFGYYNGKRPIIIEKDEIRHIEVNGNIGVVLRKEKGNGVNVGIDKQVTDKIKFTVRDGKLTISAKDPASTEQLVVYAWFDDLETLTLTGKVVVASVGILNYENLQVNLDKEAKISLKTTGRIRINAPGDYQYVQREQYHSVHTNAMF